jgi:hypothetical protein
MLFLPMKEQHDQWSRKAGADSINPELPILRSNIATNIAAITCDQPVFPVCPVGSLCKTMIVQIALGYATLLTLHQFF